MTVLVTGATGFLGSHVVDLLVERGAPPRVLAEPGTTPAWDASSGVEPIVADVRDEAALRTAVRDVDSVLHCAARTGPWGRADEYQSTNVDALETLVRVASAHGVRRVVHVSSITVHGNDVRGAADETAPFRVEPNPYSRSKVAGELRLRALADTLRVGVTIVRPGYIYGPRDENGFARIATRVREGRMVIVGSGDNRVPLVHVRDVAAGILRAAEVERAAGREYLLVNDEPVTQREYLNEIARQLGVAAPTRRIPYRVALSLGRACELGARAAGAERPPPLMRYGVQVLGGENRFEIGRARRELGFAPQVDLESGVRDGVAWYLASVDHRDVARSS